MKQEKFEQFRDLLRSTELLIVLERTIVGQALVTVSENEAVVGNVQWHKAMCI